MKKVIRSLKFSLDFSNVGKLEALDELCEEYKRVVNLILERLEKRETDDFSYDFLKSINTSLGAHFRQTALRHAFKIWKRFCRSRKSKKGKAKAPRLKSDVIMLTSEEIGISRSKKAKSFDYWIRIASLTRRKRIVCPVKSYEYANNFFKVWNKRNGAQLVKRNGKWFLVLSFEKEIQPSESDKVKAVDIGYRKLLTTSDREVFGDKISEICEKASRKKQGSKRWKKTLEEVKSYIGYAINQLFSAEIPGILVLEDLKNLKKNKHGRWSKEVNRLFNFWLYGLTLRRLQEKSDLLGVRVERVSPSFTSQTCPVCGHIEKSNRRGELFECVNCDFSDDADIVGAMNILSRFAEERKVPRERG